MNLNQRIERFFETTWSDAVYNARFFIFVVFFGWLGFAIWKATQISPLTEAETFIPDDHPS